MNLEPINYDLSPIEFINQVMPRYKAWLNKRNSSGEALRYMREAVDQVGRGKEFIKFMVYNDKPLNDDPFDPRNDLALLQIYDFWREHNKWQPIDPWDGSRLRPWLPEENNPKVSKLLTGDLSHFHDAWSRFTPSGSSPDPYQWDPIDAFGLEVEGYFHDIRNHATWSRPKSGGKLRFYRFNELNNIEVAPYSIRFWGFLKWTDYLRKILLNEKGSSEELLNAPAGDIAFFDEFNIKHFSWHDDVFENGKCDDIYNQFGLKQRHKHMMKHHGYAVEFLEFHGDLLKAYNKRMSETGMPSTSSWIPDEHNSAHILKLAFGGPWGLGNSNGKILNIEDYAPELIDDELLSFKTGAELGYYLENCGIAWHGMGHVQNCDIRDVYTNNYSIRFFGWHQWIDSMYRKILDSGKPVYDKTKPLDKPLQNFCADKTHFPKIISPYTGTWVYRSYKNDPNADGDTSWFVAIMRLFQSSGLSPDGRPTDIVVGELDSGYADYRYRLTGYIDNNNIGYETKPREHDERSILVMKAEGMTEATRGHVYEYRGYFQTPFSNGKDQTPTFSGSMMRAIRPDNSDLEGTVGTFHSVLSQEDRSDFFEDGYYAVPKGVKEIEIEVWGAGGGGGSDAPGVGGIDGQSGTHTFVEIVDPITIQSDSWVWDGVSGQWTVRPLIDFQTHNIDNVVLKAEGGEGGQHGVNREAKGGKGGLSENGQNNIFGQNGESANVFDGYSGKGGDCLKAGKAGLGGKRVPVQTSGENGLFPGGGGSGAQMAHTPGGGGGGGAYSYKKIDVQEGQIFKIAVGKGGDGGAEGFMNGGNGADGLVVIIPK
jgi:hypothetical protein